MKKTILFSIVFFLSAAFNLRAQTLFTYGNNNVSKEEFLRAFNKNSNGEKPTEKAYQDYLDLYIRFKLKVQAAYDKKMDTLPNQRAELQSFRNQVIEGFMTDDSSLQALIDEAFERSQKDIHLAHIFIPFDSQNLADTSLAFKKANDAYNELLRGSDFGNVARVYSADSSVQTQRGDIGYITVFSLPYTLETIAYTTPAGTFSKPFRTKKGYHIFKNIEERTAVGRIRVAQILLLFPPDANNEVKNAIKLRADSIYMALQKGADFKTLASTLSNDNLTYQIGGEMPEFGVGTYNTKFENAAFSLNKDGEISKPILTSQGYHIIKRLSVTPVNTSIDSVRAMSALRQQVLGDARRNLIKSAITEKMYRLTKFKKEEISETKLWEYYRDHLEEYNPEFAAQIKEFKEGNLLFEMMQATIWEKAANDSIGLKKYYQSNKEKYWWEPSADVIIFTCNDPATAIAVRTAFSINTSGWHDIIKSYADKAQADSGRYELSQLPAVDSAMLKPGIITQPITNSADNTSSFMYIRKIYSERSPRNFNEAKGFVLNDYQTYLEDKWIDELKKKYPVKINEDVLKSL